MRNGILFFMHTETNAGYAIGTLEQTFYAAAVGAGLDPREIHFCYTSSESGPPNWMGKQGNFTVFDKDWGNVDKERALISYLVSNRINVVFAFDLQPSSRANKLFRTGGVGKIISYWGAPISNANSGLFLLAKKLEVFLRRSGPDLYLFESKAMLELAIGGRGVSHRKARIIPTGVDTELYHPQSGGTYAHDTFGIPSDQKIFVYSGHMEERKGVDVIVKALNILCQRNEKIGVHVLILGNRPGEERRFDELMTTSSTREHITFGGYRDDMPKIYGSCLCGVIASKGWDSWPMSVIEMAASGIPIIVSRLQGLNEFVKHGKEGFSFPAGDHEALADCIASMSADPLSASAMGAAARNKVVHDYSLNLQIQRLSTTIRSVWVN